LAGVTEETGDGPPRNPGAEPGRAERPRLRRGPLGYRRADVDAALAARDEELAELRRDIAALWLAFTEHDRLLRELGDAQVPPAPPSGDPDPPPTPPPVVGADETPSIGAQLEELGDVLAAIEMATQALESTYADEIRDPAPGAEAERPAS
jgi:hypothetical protein